MGSSPTPSAIIMDLPLLLKTWFIENNSVYFGWHVVDDVIYRGKRRIFEIGDVIVGGYSRDYKDYIMLDSRDPEFFTQLDTEISKIELDIAMYPD